MTGKSVVFVSFIILSILLENIHGWRTFWKGRRSGGNLVHPHVNVSQYQLPPDEWFEQRLDHFNESNKATWKQVGFV